MGAEKYKFCALSGENWTLQGSGNQFATRSWAFVSMCFAGSGRAGEFFLESRTKFGQFSGKVLFECFVLDAVCT